MTRLFLIPEKEFALQPNDVKYQRMRYERSIEGMLYIAYLRKGFSYEVSAQKARKRADYLVANWDRYKTDPRALEID